MTRTNNKIRGVQTELVFNHLSTNFQVRQNIYMYINFSACIKINDILFDDKMQGLP